MKREGLYEAPQAEILELHTEGVLCASGDDIPDFIIASPKSEI